MTKKQPPRNLKTNVGS